LAATDKAMTSSTAVAETFEAELAAIKEKGKDLKGETKVFYGSIVDRVSNNVQVLADLRKEHTQLRTKLGKVVRAKASKNTRCDLEGDLKHMQHEVNLLKRQIDRLKCGRDNSIADQHELEVVLANYASAEAQEHPRSSGSRT